MAQQLASDGNAGWPPDTSGSLPSPDEGTVPDQGPISSTAGPDAALYCSTIRLSAPDDRSDALAGVRQQHFATCTPQPTHAAQAGQESAAGAAESAVNTVQGQQVMGAPTVQPQHVHVQSDSSCSASATTSTRSTSSSGKAPDQSRAQRSSTSKSAAQTAPTISWNQFQRMYKGLGWTQQDKSTLWQLYKETGQLPDVIPPAAPQQYTAGTVQHDQQHNGAGAVQQGRCSEAAGNVLPQQQCPVPPSQQQQQQEPTKAAKPNLRSRLRLMTWNKFQAYCKQLGLGWGKAKVSQEYQQYKETKQLPAAGSTGDAAVLPGFGSGGAPPGSGSSAGQGRGAAAAAAGAGAGSVQALLGRSSSSHQVVLTGPVTRSRGSQAATCQLQQGPQDPQQQQGAVHIPARGTCAQHSATPTKTRGRSQAAQAPAAAAPTTAPTKAAANGHQHRGRSAAARMGSAAALLLSRAAAGVRRGRQLLLSFKRRTLPAGRSRSGDHRSQPTSSRAAGAHVATPVRTRSQSLSRHSAAIHLQLRSPYRAIGGPAVGSPYRRLPVAAGGGGGVLVTPQRNGPTMNSSSSRGRSLARPLGPHCRGRSREVASPRSSSALHNSSRSRSRGRLGGPPQLTSPHRQSTPRLTSPQGQTTLQFHTRPSARVTSPAYHHQQQQQQQAMLPSRSSCVLAHTPTGLRQQQQCYPANGTPPSSSSSAAASETPPTRRRLQWADHPPTAPSTTPRQRQRQRQQQQQSTGAVTQQPASSTPQKQQQQQQKQQRTIAALAQPPVALSSSSTAAKQQQSTAALTPAAQTRSAAAPARQPTLSAAAGPGVARNLFAARHPGSSPAPAATSGAAAATAAAAAAAAASDDGQIDLFAARHPRLASMTSAMTGAAGTPPSAARLSRHQGQGGNRVWREELHHRDPAFFKDFSEWHPVDPKQIHLVKTAIPNRPGIYEWGAAWNADQLRKWLQQQASSSSSSTSGCAGSSVAASGSGGSGAEDSSSSSSSSSQGVWTGRLRSRLAKQLHINGHDITCIYLGKAGSLAGHKKETLRSRFSQYALIEQQVVGPQREKAKNQKWQALQKAGHPLYIRWKVATDTEPIDMERELLQAVDYPINIVNNCH